MLRILQHVEDSHLCMFLYHVTSGGYRLKSVKRKKKLVVFSFCRKIWTHGFKFKK